MAKGETKRVNIKTEGKSRDEIMASIEMHLAACQRATAMVWTMFGDEGLEGLREGLAQASDAVNGE
jgi:hypothetical protein